ncbi:MAG: putative Zn-dependent protease [Gammaproteobacteria bacterium]|jgi:predicted Zn-dependent protease
MNLKSIGLILASLLMIVAAGADAAGRKRISQDELDIIYSKADIIKELEFGRNMAAQLLGDYQLIKNQELLKYINLVGQVVLQQSSRQEINYYFGVIHADEVNAYATPGGYIFLTTGALALMQSEAELAGVLAHEIAHVAERHIVKALEIRAADDSSTGLLGQITSGGSSSATVLFNQAMGKAFDILYGSGLRIEDEFSADELGILLTSLAGYDTAPYFNYLERIKPIVEDAGQRLSRTHPSFDDRIQHLKTIYQGQGLLELGGSINRQRLLRYKKLDIEDEQ